MVRLPGAAGSIAVAIHMVIEHAGATPRRPVVVRLCSTARAPGGTIWTRLGDTTTASVGRSVVEGAGTTPSSGTVRFPLHLPAAADVARPVIFDAVAAAVSGSPIK